MGVQAPSPFRNTFLQAAGEALPLFELEVGTGVP